MLHATCLRIKKFELLPCYMLHVTCYMLHAILFSMRHSAKILIALVAAAALLIGVRFYTLVKENRIRARNHVGWGVTFSPRQATFLGLDWKETYRALLTDLGVRRLRLAAYWDDIEPHRGQFTWDALDWQLREAEKIGAKVHLVVGRRAPRWPECHIPAWASKLDEQEQQLRTLAAIRATITQTKQSSAIVRWQVENEPLLDEFGVCPLGDRDFLKQEIDLVRSLDSRPVATTESGELSTWVRTAPLVDVLGISLYRVTWSRFWGNFYYPLTPAYYRNKAEAVSLLGPTVIITELQAEPWGPKPVSEMTIEEQFASMSPSRVAANIEFARRVGLPEVYLWGAEWWYWLKRNGRPEIWDETKKIFN